MLRNKDVDRLKVLDRLINLENDTIDDLIEQAVTVARMIEPKLDDIASYGPIERMVMQVQEMQRDVKELRDTVRVLNMRLASNGTTSTWPSNPGFAPGTAYPLTTTSGGTGGYQPGYGPTMSISTGSSTSFANIAPLIAVDVQELMKYTHIEQETKTLSEFIQKQLQNIPGSLKNNTKT